MRPVYRDKYNGSGLRADKDYNIGTKICGCEVIDPYISESRQH